MKYFNPKKYSYYDFMRKYKHYKNIIKKLNQEVINLRNHEASNNNEVASLQSTLDKREEQIASMKQIIMDNTHIKPKPKVLDSAKVLKYPSNHSNVPGDGLPDSIATLQLDKDSRYTISCSVPLGQALSITQYPTSENNSVYEAPGNKFNKYVTFIGKNKDDGDSNHIIMNFQSNVSDTLYLVPKWWTNTKNYVFTNYEEPYDNPRFPYYDIPTPDMSVKGRHPRINQKVIKLLETLINNLKDGRVDISDVFFNSDENNDISYKFTADSIKPQYTFNKAMNQLNNTNGMRRASTTHDWWLELDSHGKLVQKYRGSDNLVPYQPTYKDMNAKDWEVVQIRPYNPNTKPYGSDNWDDLNDTNMFGYDGDTPQDGDF